MIPSPPRCPLTQIIQGSQSIPLYRLPLMIPSPPRCPLTQIIQGSQSIPLYRLPLMISAQRKFSFHGAMLDFSVTKSDGQPGGLGSGGGEGAPLPSLMGSRVSEVA